MRVISAITFKLFLRRLAIVLPVLLFLALMSSPAWAQTTGTIFGTVTDPSGAVVPNASVSVLNQNTGYSRNLATDSQGQYIVTLLPVGRYSVSAEAAGFEKSVLRDVVVQVNENVRVDVVFVVKKVAQEVVVQSGGEVAVETRSATVGKVVDERRIVELPLNERNFLNLATLQPGVVPPMTITSNNTPEFSGGVKSTPQVNGLRLQSNNFLLDGADNNEPFLGTAMATPSPDALEEFRILTNLFTAEFGGGGGSIVNIITRQGTNDLHASVYEFFRNDVLDARNFFAANREKLRRNQFGVSAGGPLVHDKTFLFGNYEGFRQRAGETRIASVPSVAQRAGNFGTFSVAPANFDPVATNLLALIPPPNQGTNGFTSSPVTQNDSNQFTVRVDHSFTSKNSLYARYHFNEGMIRRFFTNTLFGISIDLPNFPLEDSFRLQNLAVTDTHVFSARLSNEGRFAFNRGRFDSAVPLTPRDPASFGFNLPSTKAIKNLPLVAVVGLSAFGTFNDSPSFRREDVFQFQDNVSYIRGAHTFKFGANVLLTHMDIPSSDSIGEGAFLFVGAFTGIPFADFLEGKPLVFFQGGGSTNRDWRFSSYNFFFEDDYRVTRTFTVNLGLRYELPIPPVDTRDRVVALRPGTVSTVNPKAPPGLLFVGDPGITRSTIETDKNNFAPRIGFAWDVRGNGKISLRGGYGIFYDRLIGLLPFQFGLVPPFYIIPAIVPPPSFGNPFQGNSPFAGKTAEQIATANIFPPFSFLQIMDKNMRTPYVQQWNLSLQWEVVKDLVFEMGYVATKSTKLPQAVNINSANLTPNATPFNVDSRRPFAPFFGQTSNYQTTALANYHSLQLSANKRTSHGLSFLASYTWSKSIDTASIPVNFLNPTGEAVFPETRTNLRLERGRSAYDTRHRFVGNFLYELPFWKTRTDALGNALGNWQVNGIVTLQTGTPFTVLDGSDPNLDGDATDRPNLVGDPFANARTPERFFNVAAFARPAPGTNGNAGRNILSGPGVNNFDFSIFKNFKLFKERSTLQFRSEFFNLFNHANFDLPVNDINSPNAGGILRTRLNARQIQFGLKLLL